MKLRSVLSVTGALALGLVFQHLQVPMYRYMVRLFPKKPMPKYW